MKKFGIIALAILLFGCCGLTLGGIALFGYTNNVRNEVIRQETALTRQYLSNQAQLSGYVTSFYEQIGIANLKSDQMDRILTDAVQGRYEGNMQPGTGGAMFSAIVEAYPELDLALYDDILNFVQEKRQEYADDQATLIGMLTEYDNYRNQDFIRSFIVRNIVGAPTDALEARLGDRTLRGQAALDSMYVIVLDRKTIEAYETGILDPLPVPGPNSNRDE